MTKAYHIRNIIQTRDPQLILRPNTRDPKDNGLINSDSRNSNPFLQDLESCHQLYATGGIQFPGADTEEHGEVAVFLARLALELANIDNILEFGFCQAIILAGLASEAAKDIARFVLTADFHELTGRLRLEVNNAEKKYKRGNLECYGKSPYEG